MGKIEEIQNRHHKWVQERQRRLASILDSVASRLKANDLDGAYQICRDERPESENPEVLDLFKQHPPSEPKCDICGTERGLTLNYYWQGDHKGWRPQPCEQCSIKTIRDDLRADIHGHMAKCGTPKRFLLASTRDFPPVIRNTAESGKSLYIEGPAGTGKTHLAAAIVRHHIMNAPVRVSVNSDFFSPPLKHYQAPSTKLFPYFVSVPQLLQKIRASYNGGHESEGKILSTCRAADLLILDDLAAEKATDWVRQMVHVIVDDRYNNMKQTIITSNLGLDSIGQALDDRIASRIAGMCELVRMGGRDRRLSEPKGAEHPAADIQIQKPKALPDWF